MARDAREMARKQDKTNRNKLKYVIIAWDDHYSLDDTWHSVEVVDELGAKTMVSGGWLIREDAKRYVISRDYDISGDNHETVGGTLVILKGTVKKKWVVGTLGDIIR